MTLHPIPSEYEENFVFFLSVYQANCWHFFHDVDPDSVGPVDPD
jgi:hypothetical protein